MTYDAYDPIGRFPDRPASGSNRPPATIANVEHLLAHHGITVRYNEVKKRDEIEIPGRTGSADNVDNVTLGYIVSLAAKHHMPTGTVASLLEVIANKNAYNPVRDWILSRPWDGVDRFPALLAAICEREGFPPELKAVLIRKWLRSAAAAHTVENFRTRGVLTLQGPQGAGKSSFVKSLIGDKALADSAIKLGHHLDAANKDSLLGAICYAIVELGELDSSIKKDMARLKGFLTDDFDRLRRPYDRREASYPRRTVFAATVNETQFLMDSTGNTRFWTIPVVSLDWAHGVDTQQLFAQAAAEVASGAAWWLDAAEEAALEGTNARHEVASPAAELLADAVAGEGEKADRVEALTASEVARRLDLPSTTGAAREMGAALRRLLGEPKKIRGIYKWRIAWKAADAKGTMPEKTKALLANDNAAVSQADDVY